MSTENNQVMNNEITASVDETLIQDVKKSPGRPAVAGSKRQLLLQKKNLLKTAGVIEAGRPINIEKTEALIRELQAKVKSAKLRMKIETKIDSTLGLS